VVSESPYFGIYERRAVQWRLSVGEVDGELVILIMEREVTDRFTPRAVVRLDVVDGQITRITDYVHCPWVLQPAASVIVGPPLPN
jgi:hypothetical protein